MNHQADLHYAVIIPFYDAFRFTEILMLGVLITFIPPLLYFDFLWALAKLISDCDAYISIKLFEMPKAPPRKSSAIEADSVIASGADLSILPSTIGRSKSEILAGKSQPPTPNKTKGLTQEEKAKGPKPEEKAKFQAPNDDDSAKKLFAEKVFKCFAPYKYFSYIFLRFPLKGAVTPTGYIFTYSKFSLPAIGFIITNIIVTITAFLFLFNTIGFALDFPPIQPLGLNTSHNIYDGDLRFEEQYIVRRNFIPLLILISSLCHATVGSWQLYKQRHFAASYLTFWTEIVEIIAIDVANGVKRYMTIVIISYSVFLVCFFAICATRFAPVASGGPGLLAMFLVRCFYPAIHTDKNFWIARGFGGILFFYVMICSKTFVLLFVLVCRLLRNAFSVWNSRLERVLLQGWSNVVTTMLRYWRAYYLFFINHWRFSNPLDSGEDKLKSEHKLSERTDFDTLFKDHVCLLDAMQGADTLFANIIESYYASQVCSIIFEVYYFYRSQSSEEFKEARRLDGIIITLYLIHSLAILVVVSLAAAEVGEVAMEGLEVLRRRGMMGTMKDDELYFIMSMYTSYTGHFETALRGGGYFTLDKGFLVAIVGTVFSYFIILLQFSPPLAITQPIDSKVNYYNTSRLIKQVESSIQIIKTLQVGYMQLKEVSELGDESVEYDATTDMWYNEDI